MPDTERHMAGLAEGALEGLAVLDPDGRFAWVNPAGCRILGGEVADLVGSPAPFAAAGVAPHTGRELEYRTFPLGADRGVAFRDVTEHRRQQRRFVAFVSAIERVAEGGSLRETLDAVCAAVVRTTDLAGAQILLLDADGHRLQLHGAAPAAAWPPDFTARLEEARKRGARLSSLVAHRTGRPVVQRGRRAELLADPAWEPLHDQFRAFAWETFVSAPLRARTTALGSLNVYYQPGHHPDDEEVTFLVAMAEQAAVAVENGRLFAESRGRAAVEERHRLARELHDSACQQLFSMTLHLRAAELALPARGPTAATVRTLDHLAHAALNDLRALIVELYPALLQGVGLVTAVRRQAAAAERLGLEVTVEAEGDPLDLEPEAELAAYRVVQEAVHNAAKHASGARVCVRLGADPAAPATLVVEVADDGPGFDPAEPTGGLGLTSMRQRAERCGGALQVTTAPGRGTTVRAVLPNALGGAGT